MSPSMIRTISIHLIVCVCLTAVLALFGVSVFIAAPVGVVLTLAGGFAYKKWREAVEKKLAKSVSGILALKNATVSSRLDSVYWPGKEILSVVVDKEKNRAYFIDYKYFSGVKNYYSYDISKLGCVAPYVNFDLKNHSEEEKSVQDDKKRKKKLLAIEIREKNPDQPGGMRDIQLYPINRMRLFTVPCKREDDDMFVFATHAAAMVMDAITEYLTREADKA